MSSSRAVFMAELNFVHGILIGFGALCCPIVLAVVLYNARRVKQLHLEKQQLRRLKTSLKSSDRGRSIAPKRRFSLDRRTLSMFAPRRRLVTAPIAPGDSIEQTIGPAEMPALKAAVAATRATASSEALALDPTPVTPTTFSHVAPLRHIAPRSARGAETVPLFVL